MNDPKDILAGTQAARSDPKGSSGVRVIAPPRSRSRSKEVAANETLNATCFHAKRTEGLTEELYCVLIERLPVPMAKKAMSRNQKLEKAGKTLNYEKEDAKMKAGLDVSSGVEWAKWKQVHAGSPRR